MLKNLAIRVDGNKHIGLGHIFRCIHLATALKENYEVNVCFHLLESSLNKNISYFLKQNNITYEVVSQQDDQWADDLNIFYKKISCGKYDAVLLDLLIPDSTDKDLLENPEYKPASVTQYLDTTKNIDIPVFAMSDQFNTMSLNADIIINTCPVQRIEWYNNQCTYLLGPKYYILPNSFRRLTSQNKEFSNDKPKIVIFCGGNDHCNFTDIFLSVLKPYMESIKVEVILGAATPNIEYISKKLARSKIVVHSKKPDLAPIFFSADLVLSTSGNTLFDLAALGVPSAAVSTRIRQNQTTRFFAEGGSCIDLGFNQDTIEESLPNFIQTALQDHNQLQRMSMAGRRLVDGNGTFRILDNMCNHNMHIH